MTVWLQGAAIFGVAVSAWRVMAQDARHCRISFFWTAMLAFSGAVWWASVGPFPQALAGGAVAGLVTGALAGFLPILAAHLLGRAWPLMTGDILLLGALGCVTGPWAFAPALAAGCLGAVVHRHCVQRKRGRPFAKGYLPLAPGFAAGVMVLFALQVAGVVPMRPPGLA